MAIAEGKQATPTYQPLIVVLVAVSVGIIADRYLAIPISFWLLLAIVSIGGWSWRRRSGGYLIAAILLLIAAAAAGGAWHHRCWYLFADDDLGHFATLEPRPVVIEGVAQGAPRRMPAPPRNPLRAIQTGDRTRLDLQVTGLRDSSTWQSASGNTTLIVNGHLVDVFAGDRVVNR